MKLNIEIDDDTLSKLIKDEINRIDEKTVHDIAVTALKTYFSIPENTEKLIFDQNYGRCTDMKPWFREMMQNTLRPEDIRQYVDTIMNIAREKGHEMLLGALAECLVRNLFTYDNQQLVIDKFMESLRQR